MEQGRREHGARVPRRDDRGRVPVSDRADGPDERRVGLRAHRLGRLVAHRDPVAAGHELEPRAGERLRPVEDRCDRVRRGLERAGDDLVRGVIAPESVDRDARRHAG